MRKLILVAALIFVLPLSSLAADYAKFGSIDLQKVLNESEAGKKDAPQLGSAKP